MSQRDIAPQWFEGADGGAFAGALRHALVDEDIRKIDAWTARYHVATVEFEAAPHDPFFNANRPEDFAEAERLLDELG